MHAVSLSDFVNTSGSDLLEPVDNERLFKLTGKPVRKIENSTHMNRRHVIKPGVTAFDLAREAMKRFQERTGLESGDFEGLSLVYTTYDEKMENAESIASRLAEHIGMSRTNIQAISYGCAGFPKILSLASPLAQEMQQGKHRLIVMVELPSTMLNAKSAKEALLFGDSACATSLHTGDGHTLLFAEAEDVEPKDRPADRSIFTFERALVYDFHEKEVERTIFKMDGEIVYNYAMHHMITETRAIIEKVMKDPSHHGRRVLVVPHQPNGKMLDLLHQYSEKELMGEYSVRFKIPEIRFVNRIDGPGNTVSCTIPHTIAELEKDLTAEDAPRDGDMIAMPAMGICVADPGKKMSIGRAAMIWNGRKSSK
jgi:3-oxoacyl-[acyl-carrier-protein] synthase III